MKKFQNAPQLVTLVLIVMVLGTTVHAQTTEDVSYTWTAPTSGSPVDHYVVQHSLNGGPFVTIASVTTEAFILIASIGDSHQIRVAGVDADDRQGPYSLASDSYTPQLGAPGQPGQPIALF